MSNHLLNSPWVRKVIGCAAFMAGLLASVVLPGQPVKAASPVQIDNRGSQLSQADAVADFDFMRKALEEAHTGLYRYSTKDEMDRMFAAQRAKLSHSMSKAEFIGVLSETVAKIKCGHSGVIPDDELRAAVKSAPMFPLGLLVEGSRLMVLSNETMDDRTILPGMEILEINGRKASEILDRMLPMVPSDGDIETRKRMSIQREFAGYYWLLIDQSGEFTVIARDAAGKTVTANLVGVTMAEWGRSGNPVNAAAQQSIGAIRGSNGKLSLQFFMESQAALVRIRLFNGDDFPKWIENTFRSLAERKTRVLIIDVRGNGGGIDEYGAMTVSYLTDKPFRYFDHIHLKTIDPSFKDHSDWNADLAGWVRAKLAPNPEGGYLITPQLNSTVSQQRPAKYPFLGKVFILTDGGTFSTAADFCAVTHLLRRATFIGEETGGGYLGNNSGLSVVLTLPISQMRVKIPMYEYWRVVPGSEGNRRGTLPDRVVETKTANLIQGVDEPLELALDLAAEFLDQDSRQRSAETVGQE